MSVGGFGRLRNVRIRRCLCGAGVPGREITVVRGIRSVGFGSILLLSVALAWSSVAAADCPFGWPGQPAIPGVETTVEAITVWDPDGSGPQPSVLVVGGSTNNPATGQNSGSVATWDGTTWTQLGSGMNDQVKALSVHNGMLIVGGLFIIADGNTVNCIAWWDGATWQSLGGGVTAAFPPKVHALLNYNGNLLVGGGFTTAGGQGISRSIALWDGQGWQSMSPGLNAAVVAMTTFNGELVVGGAFTATVGAGGGAPVNCIAQRAGNSWQPMPAGVNNGMDNHVHALTVFGGDLIAGGLFTMAGGTTAHSIARWDGNTWNPLGAGMGGTDPTVNALAVYEGKLIAGGRFSTADGHPANYIAQWDGNGWQELGSGFNKRVEALTVHDGALIAGGFFTNGNNVNTAYVARWPGCVRGDMNCDQLIDAADVPLFIDALLTAPAISTCDAHIANMNNDFASDGDPRVDGSDVPDFVAAVLGS
ncbi:hypothetical protein B7486_01900 [cyanobacterium TDX16]|nr:hypothetical protein B7486_01900 [cyanobacterium TDX16]